MGVKRAANGWQVVARVRVDGKIRHKQATIDARKEDAKALLEQFKKELRGEVVWSLKIPKSPRTFNDLLTLYEEKRGGDGPSYDSRIKRLRADLGGVSLPEFPDRFERYLALYKVTPLETTRRPPKPGTYNRLLEIVKTCFNLAASLQLIPHSPITSARFPKQKEKARDRYLDEQEKTRLLNAVERYAPHLYPVVRYALLVPSRKSELVNLRRENYNMLTNTVYIADSKAGMPIHKPVPAEMQEHFQSIPPECPWVFFRKDKKGYHPLGDFRKAFKRCLREAGITNFRFHDTRHVSSTDLYAIGNTEREIMDIAGWKTPMLSTYWHKDSLRSAQRIRFGRKCDSRDGGVIPKQAFGG